MKALKIPDEIFELVMSKARIKQLKDMNDAQNNQIMKLTDKEVLERVLAKIDKSYLMDFFDSAYENHGLRSDSIRACLFSHDIAKAFWGKESCYNEEGMVKDECATMSPDINYIWQYHLQRMVLHDNPLDYLRKFIEE
jgi:hypothetical protein